MSYSTDNFQVVLESFQLGADSPLDSRTIRRALAEAECDFGSQEHTIFNRETTLGAFLYEMLHTGMQRTLQAAVLAVRPLQIVKGLDPNSPNTGTYVAARARIDVAVSVAMKSRDFVPGDPFHERPHAPCLHQRHANGSLGDPGGKSTEPL